jgi:hypothetical protein
MKNGIVKGCHSFSLSPHAVSLGYYIMTTAYYITIYDWDVRSILEIHEYRKIGS